MKRNSRTSEIEIGDTAELTFPVVIHTQLDNG